MPDPDTKKPRHTLADHTLGADPHHHHDEASDHEHDHLDDANGHEAGPPSPVSLTSIGIDIGSAGMQVAFSRLHMQRLGEGYASRFVSGSRELVYQSPVTFTPYCDTNHIDARAVCAIVDDAFDSANLHPDDIDTGVVLLTGMALRRDNAHAITHALADRCGDIVSAAAGHHMEAALAAFGSGAAKLSHDGARRILNIDIGGGTTKIALIDNGHVEATAAVAIGSRLVAFDPDGRIILLEPAARYYAERLGLTLALETVPAAQDLDKLADAMAQDLLAELNSPGSIPEQLRLTAPLFRARAPGDAMVMSGGVAEFIYGRETRDFRDIGRRLGHRVGQRLAAAPLAIPLLPATERIRATVIGATAHAVQLSGQNCFFSNPAIVPIRGLRVIAPRLPSASSFSTIEVTTAIAAHRRIYGLGNDEMAAIAIRWSGEPDHNRLLALAQGIAQSMAELIASGKPLVIIVDADVARDLGFILKEEICVATDVVVLDGITLVDFDYLDIGRLRIPSFTVPVTIKSLAFQHDWRQEAALKAAAHSHHHHHEHHQHVHDHSHDNNES